MTLTEAKIKFYEESPINDAAELLRQTVFFIDSRDEILNNNCSTQKLINDFLRSKYNIESC